MNRTTAPARTREGDVEEWDEPLVEAFLNASRVLVAVAARSLAAGDAEITLPQYRSLVVLASRGPQRVSDLAVLLAVNTSTATRQCDRLERRGLLERARSSDDRRSVVVSITPVGLALVGRVSEARRQEIGRVLGSMTPEHRDELLAALRQFSAAAGEVPEQSWTLGWGPDVARP